MEDKSFSELKQVDQAFLELLEKRTQLLQAWQRRRLEQGLSPLSLADTLTPLPSALPIPHSAGKLLWRQWADASLSVFGPRTRFAFLGPVYSFSYLAGLQYFGAGLEYVPVGSIAAVFDEVSRGHSQWGIVPIENSTDGRVIDTLTLFSRHPLSIIGETTLPIHHCLMGRGPRNQIREVHSKPQALSQCRDWLSKHLPEAKLIENSSTTAAARYASEQPGIAAIASREAAQQYGLEILEENIEDQTDNATRFVILGKEEAAPTAHDKTSLLFRVAHHPGALSDAILVFRECQINLTWIESIPVFDSDHEYQFFVEFVGHRQQAAVAECIQRLQAQCLRIQVLGSYPRDVASV